MCSVLEKLVYSSYLSIYTETIYIVLWTPDNIDTSNTKKKLITLSYVLLTHIFVLGVEESKFKYYPKSKQ
jgi:hypothetical protein